MNGRSKLAVAARALGFAVWMGAPAAAEDASARALENLARATAALDRFQDVEAAEAAGYVKPGNNDGFEMGEHWYRPDLLEDPVCRLEAPQFLQYLVIDGRRTLIGTGYVCDARVGAPDWFGEVAWHQHGPEGDLRRRWQGASLAAGAGLWDHSRVGRAFRRAEKHAAAQVERMRVAEHSADAAAWAEAARAGAALGPAVEAEVAALLDGAERAVAERFLASLVVHDHGGRAPQPPLPDHYLVWGEEAACADFPGSRRWSSESSSWLLLRRRPRFST